MTRVRIPPTLRAEVGGAREIEASGSTLREVLADLAERFPGLGRQVLDDGNGGVPGTNCETTAPLCAIRRASCRFSGG